MKWRIKELANLIYVTWHMTHITGSECIEMSSRQRSAAGVTQSCLPRISYEFWSMNQTYHIVDSWSNDNCISLGHNASSRCALPFCKSARIWGFKKFPACKT